MVPGLSLEQVDTMATQYPLCMSSLLQSLRKKHRLGHHARVCWIRVIKFSLILFLPKDWEADPGLSEMLCLQLISCILQLVSLLVKRWAVA